MLIPPLAAVAAHRARLVLPLRLGQEVALSSEHLQAGGSGWACVIGQCCAVIRLLIFLDLSGEAALCFLFHPAVTVLPDFLHASGPCCWSPGSDWLVIRRLQGSLTFIDHWYCAVFPPDCKGRHPRSCSAYHLLSCAGVADAEVRSVVCKTLMPPPGS